MDGGSGRAPWNPLPVHIGLKVSSQINNASGPGSPGPDALSAGWLDSSGRAGASGQAVSVEKWSHPAFGRTPFVWLKSAKGCWRFLDGGSGGMAISARMFK